jgi:hypothetical protein
MYLGQACLNSMYCKLSSPSSLSSSERVFNEFEALSNSTIALDSFPRVRSALATASSVRYVNGMYTVRPYLSHSLWTFDGISRLRSDSTKRRPAVCVGNRCDLLGAAVRSLPGAAASNAGHESAKSDADDGTIALPASVVSALLNMRC